MGFGSFLIVVLCQRAEENDLGYNVFRRIGVGMFPGEKYKETPFDPLDHDYVLLV
jgi:hypothetical protein